MAQIGEAASACLSHSVSQYGSSSPGQPGQPSPTESGAQYAGTEAQHSPFTELAQGAGVQEFHAEFITQPLNYNPGERATPPRITGSPEQSPSPSSVSPINTLPSFMDTYTPSVVTIEPRPFGSEADYEGRQGAGGQKPGHGHPQHHQHPGQHHHGAQQMTVKFHLKTEAPDSFGPGSGRGHHGGHHGHAPGPPPVFASMNVGPPPHSQSYDTYQAPSHAPSHAPSYAPAHASGHESNVFYLKKEPPHSFASATPGSSPSPSPASGPLQSEFVDFFHHGSSGQAQPGAGQLTTLTNYIPFQTPDFSGHGHGHQDPNCPKFEADIESLNRVRRTILATPQPM